MTKLYKNIKDNGYQLAFLSARSIGLSDRTRSYLSTLSQEGTPLVEGPVILAPDGITTALVREVIRRCPQEFKIACLMDIRDLFPPEWNPFFAGFGNRGTDLVSYSAVGVPQGRIFTINPRGEVVCETSRYTRAWSLAGINGLIDEVFPPLGAQPPRGGLRAQQEFADFSFWRPPVLELPEEELAAAGVSAAGAGAGGAGGAAGGAGAAGASPAGSKSAEKGKGGAASSSSAVSAAAAVQQRRASGGSASLSASAPPPADEGKKHRGWRRRSGDGGGAKPPATPPPSGQTPTSGPDVPGGGGGGSSPLPAPAAAPVGGGDGSPSAGSPLRPTTPAAGGGGSAAAAATPTPTTRRVAEEGRESDGGSPKDLSPRASPVGVAGAAMPDGVIRPPVVAVV